MCAREILEGIIYALNLSLALSLNARVALHLSFIINIIHSTHTHVDRRRRRRRRRSYLIRVLAMRALARDVRFDGVGAGWWNDEHDASAHSAHVKVAGNGASSKPNTFALALRGIYAHTHTNTHYTLSKLPARHQSARNTQKPDLTIHGRRAQQQHCTHLTAAPHHQFKRIGFCTYSNRIDFTCSRRRVRKYLLKIRGWGGIADS